MNTIDDQLKEIKEIVYKNKETTERLEQNWDKDREDFAEFKNRLGHLEEEFKSLRELVLRLPQDTKNRVQDVVDSAIQETQDLKDVITDKKMIAIDVQKTKQQLKKWWNFWRR